MVRTGWYRWQATTDLTAEGPPDVGVRLSYEGLEPASTAGAEAA